MVRTLAPTLLLALSCAAQSPPAVVVNEFRYTDAGVDDHEFVELYNASQQSVDLSGWLLDAADGRQPDDNPDYRIPQGTVLRPGAHYVLGAPTVRGVDLILTHPRTGLSVDLFEDDTEALSLRDAQGRIVDTVVYEGFRGGWDPGLVEGEPIWGELTSPDAPGLSWSRLRDGRDTGDNGRDFVLRPATPGTRNDLPAARRWTESFDQLRRGTPLPGFGGSGRRPRVIDPSTADPDNPRAVPRSPQGGHAAALASPLGNGPTGSTATWLADARGAPGFEALVFLDATPIPQGERCSWSIGLRGTSDALAAPPNPGGHLAAGGPSRSGHTGVAWVFVAEAAGPVLYLMGQGSGGTTQRVMLARIPIVAGHNDGWQRLRISSRGERVHATFGGQGPDDGRQFTGWVADGAGDVYLSHYRSSPAVLSALRFDAVRIVPSAGDRSASGGSGCTGNCPIGNSKPKKVDARTGAELPSGEFAFRVTFDPADPYSVVRICYWTSKSNDAVGGLPAVSIHAVDGTGTAPLPTPMMTFALNPPAGGSGDLEGWWATPEFPAFVPTGDFYITFDHQPATDGVHPPIGIEGDPIAAHHRTSAGAPFTAWPDDLAWAWALVCPDDTAEPEPVELVPPYTGTDFKVQVQGARPGAAVFLTLGLSDRVWNGQPLPFDLGRIGAPRCSVLTSVEDALPSTADRTGTARVTIPLPNLPALAGQLLHDQWLVLDARANRLGLTTSARLSNRIGVFY